VTHSLPNDSWASHRRFNGVVLRFQHEVYLTLPRLENMDYKATLMALVLASSALAGCTGDPDGGGGDEIDSDALQDLFDEHFQDFINNTTITVINNYHNNTTYVIDDSQYNDITNNDYNNTTTVEGGEVINNYNDYDNSNTSYNFGGASFGEGVNGTVSGGNMMFVAHMEFSAQDLFPAWYIPGDRNNTFDYYWEFYDYLTNSWTNGTFTYSCGEFYLIGSLSNGSTFQVSYWEDSGNYWDAWDNEYNSSTADLLASAASDILVREACDENHSPDGHIWNGNGGPHEQLSFFSIEIPVGYAIQYIQLDTEHRWFGDANRCDPGDDTEDCENYGTSGWNGSGGDSSSVWHSYPIQYRWSEGPNPGAAEDYYGGWENITVDIGFKSYIENCCTSSWLTGYYTDFSGDTHYVVWPSSQYIFTLYYQFVPVMPVE